MVAMRALIALLIFAFTSIYAFAGDNPRDFRTWQVPTHFTEAPAPLRWNRNLHPLLFEKAFANRRYSDMANASYRWFAGKYVLIEVGCGTSCQTGFLVNRTNGKAVPNSQLPVAVSSYDYRFNSALLIVNPTDPEILANRESFWEQTTYYFVWTKRGWKKLTEEKWPTPRVSAEEVMRAALIGGSKKNKEISEPQSFRDLRGMDIPIPLPRPSKLSQLFE